MAVDIYYGYSTCINFIYLYRIHALCLHLFSSRFNFIKLQLADFFNLMRCFFFFLTVQTKLNNTAFANSIPLLTVSTAAPLRSSFLLHCSCNKVFLLSLGGTQEDSIIFIKKHETKVTILCTCKYEIDTDAVVYIDIV